MGEILRLIHLGLEKGWFSLWKFGRCRQAGIDSRSGRKVRFKTTTAGRRRDEVDGPLHISLVHRECVSVLAAGPISEGQKDDENGEKDQTRSYQRYA
jgi:hypothetical protein